MESYSFWLPLGKFANLLKGKFFFLLHSKKIVCMNLLEVSLHMVGILTCILGGGETRNYRFFFFFFSNEKGLFFKI